MDPEFAPAHANLALALTYTAPEQNRNRRAREEAERALSLMAGLGEARVALGRYDLRAGEPQAAMSHFAVAAEENPNLPMALIQLAGLQWDLGEFSAAFETLERAEALDPRNPRVIGLLGAAYRAAHRFDEALELLRRQEEVYPTSTVVHTRAYTLLLKGETDRARGVIEELILNYPQRPYQQVPQTPRTAVLRVLSEEQDRISFASYLQYDQPCTTLQQFCLLKAFREEKAGSKEAARIYWDSLSLVVERHSPGNRIEFGNATLIYQGLGEKERAIRAAEALVDLRGASTEGGTPSAPLHHEDRIFLARILAHFGEDDRAIDILQEELPVPSELTVPILELDPIWDPLRDHPRFQALLDDYRGDVEH